MLVMGEIARNACKQGLFTWSALEACDTCLRLESVLEAHTKRLSNFVKGLAYLTLAAKWIDDELCNDSAQQWVLLLEEENTNIESVIMSAFLGSEDSIAHLQWYTKKARDQVYINGLIPLPPFATVIDSPNWSGPKRGAHLG